MRPWGDGGTYFSRAEPPFCVCVCVTFRPSFLAMCRESNWRQRDLDELSLTFHLSTSNTRRSDCTISPSLTLILHHCKGRTFPPWFRFRFFRAWVIGNIRTLSTLFHPFPDLARFHRKTASSDLAQSIISIRSISWHLPISCFQPQKIN